MKENIELLYLVNAHIPNDRANGVQIVHTCEALGRNVNLTLATRKMSGTEEDVASRYGVEQTFFHTRIFCIDIPGMPLRYFVRNATFFLAANVYALGFFLKHLVSGRKAALYVRGEVILALTPLALFFPVFFETHQIRNYAWLYRIALKTARGVIVVTDRLKQKFIEEYKLPAAKIVVARDAVDTERFETITKDASIWSGYGISDEKRILLYAGTLAAEKGVDTLAAAASMLPQDSRIVFLGGTDDQVKAFRERYGHVPNITIAGRVAHTDVPHHIVSADVLVLPDSARFTYSNLYTSPMKLFEYMASGRPIVASDVPSLREVLDETTATFFTPDNADSLASTISELLQNEEKMSELGTRASEKVTAYTWAKRAEFITGHIQSRLNSR